MGGLCRREQCFHQATASATDVHRGHAPHTSLFLTDHPGQWRDDGWREGFRIEASERTGAEPRKIQEARITVPSQRMSVPRAASETLKNVRCRTSAGMLSKLLERQPESKLKVFWLGSLLKGDLFQIQFSE